jgi:hypothetical protein
VAELLIVSRLLQFAAVIVIFGCGAFRLYGLGGDLFKCPARSFFFPRAAVRDPARGKIATAAITGKSQDRPSTTRRLVWPVLAIWQSGAVLEA